MPVHVVRLGSPRSPDEGLRLGTVRRPPRGVKKADWAQRDFYDVWLPTLAPSEELLKRARPRGGSDATVNGRGAGRAVAADAHAAARAEERAWRAFERAYRREMERPDARATLDLLAALSQTTNFAVGCYCADESRCHRSILRSLLVARGAVVA